MLFLYSINLCAQQEKVAKYFDDQYVSTNNRISVGYHPDRQEFGVNYERNFFHALGLEIGISVVKPSGLGSLTNWMDEKILLSNETLQKSYLYNLSFQPKLYVYENFHLGFYSSFNLNAPEKLKEFTGMIGYNLILLTHYYIDIQAGYGLILYNNLTGSGIKSEMVITNPILIKIGYIF